MRGVTRMRFGGFCMERISTHPPHAGRDVVERKGKNSDLISTHTPHAGRDWDAKNRFGLPDISTQTPHAGRD